MKKWLPRAAAALALSYLAGLAIAASCLRYCGERFWVTAVALYLPRIGFLLPLPVIVLALAIFGPRKLLYSQVVAALLVIFPLMGFEMPSPFARAHAGKPSMRVLSFNVDSLNYGPERVAAAIEGERPDLALLQEFPGGNPQFVERLKRSFTTVEVSGQFVIATRFAIKETTEPDRLPYYGRKRSPRFMRYLVDTPLGQLAVYSVHPVSPRYGLYSLRGRQGLRREILSGRLLREARSGPMREDTGLRVLQVRTVSSKAMQEAGPVLVAGDTNLPSLSQTLSENLSALRDGFQKAGAGFGYTFPARHAWMRIDRIMASASIAFSSFNVSCRETSDHLCVVAELERAN